MNPNVRVGYNADAYDAANSGSDAASGARSWVGAASVLHGSWENRILRWFTTTWFDGRTVTGRIRKWKEEGGMEEREENGETCLINEMQVLVGNGWAHV